MGLTDINLFAFVAVSVFMAVALVIDLRTRRIPNWLTVTAFVGGLSFNLISGGWPGLLFSLGGFAVGFGALLILWLIGGGGGGDVKMMGAVGAWVGAVPTLMIFVGSAIFAILCTIALMSRQHLAPRQATAAAGGEAAPTHGGKSVLKHSVPYALPVAMATWTLLLMQLIKQVA